VCPTNLESCAGWSLVLLVGPPMLDWLKGRDQTKSDLLAFQVGDLALGQQPCPVKKSNYDTETACSLCASGHNGQ